MGVRVESSFARDFGILGSLVKLLYLSFKVINISSLLYFSELALLSAFLNFSSQSVQLECRSCFLLLRLSYLSDSREFILRVFSPGLEYLKLVL